MQELDPDDCRRKAQAILAKADAAGDRLIAAELRLLADRYLRRALELDAVRRRAAYPAADPTDPQQ